LCGGREPGAGVFERSARLTGSWGCRYEGRRESYSVDEFEGTKAFIDSGLSELIFGDQRFGELEVHLVENEKE